MVTLTIYPYDSKDDVRIVVHTFVRGIHGSSCTVEKQNLIKKFLFLSDWYTTKNVIHSIHPSDSFQDIINSAIKKVGIVTRFEL